jgi:predicted nucleic acid-binding protein
MIVVADTSPLNYLLQVGCESVLPALYKCIVVPSAVLAELYHPGTPSLVSGWLLHLLALIGILSA